MALEEVVEDLEEMWECLECPQEWEYLSHRGLLEMALLLITFLTPITMVLLRLQGRIMTIGTACPHHRALLLDAYTGHLLH